MIKFEVTNRFSGKVQFTAEIECKESERRSVKLGLAIKWAIKTGAYLRGADLSDADLSGAYLRGAYLRGAYLSGADLSDADLSGADISDADLSGAYLSDADLSDAYLRGAYLRGAYLRGAYLSGADLSDADLSGADLGCLWVSQGPTRSDGYDYKIWSSVMGGCVITAGCRTWVGSDAIAQARLHCETKTGEAHRAQALRIVDYLEGELAAYREASQ